MRTIEYRVDSLEREVRKHDGDILLLQAEIAPRPEVDLSFIADADSASKYRDINLRLGASRMREDTVEYSRLAVIMIDMAVDCYLRYANGVRLSYVIKRWAETELKRPRANIISEPHKDRLCRLVDWHMDLQESGEGCVALIEKYRTALLARDDDKKVLLPDSSKRHAFIRLIDDYHANAEAEIVLHGKLSTVVEFRNIASHGRCGDVQLRERINSCVNKKIAVYMNQALDNKRKYYDDTKILVQMLMWSLYSDASCK